MGLDSQEDKTTVSEFSRSLRQNDVASFLSGKWKGFFAAIPCYPFFYQGHILIISIFEGKETGEKLNRINNIINWNKIQYVSFHWNMAIFKPFRPKTVSRLPQTCEWTSNDRKTSKDGRLWYIFGVQYSTEFARFMSLVQTIQWFKHRWMKSIICNHPIGT